MTTPFSSNMIDHYQSANSQLWQGRSDGKGPERFHERIVSLDITQPSKSIDQTFDGKAVALIGFVCDEGVRRNQGRPGAAMGPDALRQALAPLPTASQHVVFDAGNVFCTDGNLEAAQTALGEVVAFLMQHRIFPVILGGGHELAWGTYLGEAAFDLNADRAFINCDAHLDIRPLLDNTKGTSGTSFAQIEKHRTLNNLPFSYTCLGVQSCANTPSLLEKAKELNATLVFADAFYMGGFEASLEVVDDLVIRHDTLSISLCLDVFSSAFAPGVSAPQPLGLFPWHLIPALRRAASSGKATSLGVAELCPAHDPEGITAKLAASLIADFLAHLI